MGEGGSGGGGGSWSAPGEIIHNVVCSVFYTPKQDEIIHNVVCTL